MVAELYRMRFADDPAMLAARLPAEHMMQAAPESALLVTVEFVLQAIDDGYSECDAVDEKKRLMEESARAQNRSLDFGSPDNIIDLLRSAFDHLFTEGDYITDQFIRDAINEICCMYKRDTLAK